MLMIQTILIIVAVVVVIVATALSGYVIYLKNCDNHWD